MAIDMMAMSMSQSGMVWDGDAYPDGTRFSRASGYVKIAIEHDLYTLIYLL